MESILIDHLFRHHSGKMVSVLTRIFGLVHLQMIEDAVQDTFVKASIAWRQQQPEHPEAWLTQAAKNRVFDLLRKLKAEKKLLPMVAEETDITRIHDFFLDSEIADAQLRMIFTACHPDLTPRDRIAFALKTVSGFSIKEIASALLIKAETIKKRLSRARKIITTSNLQFHIPQGVELAQRIESVMEVLYLIFNEGFHSNKKEQVVRKELCGEAMRLCQLIIKHETTRTDACYALFALMCFHAARLDAKTNTAHELMDLKHQDRQLWYFPLIKMGNDMMYRAVKNDVFSCYHYEAAIAAEHLRAKHFDATDWDKILYWYKCLHELQPMPIHLLNMSVVCMQNKDYQQAKKYLDQLEPQNFVQRVYLYYGTMAAYYQGIKNDQKALDCLDLALDTVINSQEILYLQKKKRDLLKRL